MLLGAGICGILFLAVGLLGLHNHPVCTDLTQQSEVWDFFNAVSGAVHGHSCPSRQTRSAVMVVSGSVHSKIVARKGSHGSLKTSHER